MTKRIYITERQARCLKESEGNVITAYHCSPDHKGIDEFEKNGIWLTLEEPDTVYGNNIYEYEVDMSKVNAADEEKVLAYINEDTEAQSEMERMGCDDYDIACMPWGFQWFERLKEEGHKAYMFDYDGFTYLYVFDIKDAKRLNGLINEMKGDNLHQFVDYIKKCGKTGQLSSQIELNMEYIEDNVRYVGNDIFNSDEYGQFVEENGFDWEEADEHKGDFEQMVLDRTVNDIMGMLNINERGLILVERNIKIPAFSKDDDLLDRFEAKFDGHLGEYWSYFFGQVVDPMCSGNEISFKGWVRPEDVNWTQTINANLMYPDEYELTLEYNAPIEIDRITAVSKVVINNNCSEWTIWNSPIIMQV